MKQRLPSKMIRGFQRKLTGLKSYWSEESLLTTKMVLFMAERLESLEARVIAATTNGKRTKKLPTAWQRFFAQGMRDGKAPRQISLEWRSGARKGGET